MNWTDIIDWLKDHLLTCPSKHFFYTDCPGCGFQRSIIELLKGNLMESLSLYPATIPLLSLLIYTGLHIKFDFRQGAAIIKWGFVACASIIIVFYIYKILTLKIFSL